MTEPVALAEPLALALAEALADGVCAETKYINNEARSSLILTIHIPFLSALCNQFLFRTFFVVRVPLSTSIYILFYSISQVS